MKLLCRCGHSSEAEAIRLRLDAAGIRALIGGVDQDHVGIEFSGVKVEVSEEDLDRATEILLADLRRIEQAGDWICSDCKEHNDAAFELCWHCQKPRDDLDETYFDDAAAEEMPPPVTAEISSEPSSDDGNPYRPVLLSNDLDASQSKRRHLHSALPWMLATLLIYFLLVAVFVWSIR